MFFLPHCFLLQLKKLQDLQYPLPFLQPLLRNPNPPINATETLRRDFRDPHANPENLRPEPNSTLPVHFPAIFSFLLPVQHKYNSGEIT
jgi:hypothetical protein